MDAAGDDLETLIAIDEIRRLKARFFLAVDDQDWAGYATLFTGDARFAVSGAFDGDNAAAIELEGAADAIGGAAMAQLVARALAGVRSLHIGYMPVITVCAADRAHAIWPVEDRLWLPDGTALHGFGRYDEDYVRTADGWRIARLAYRRLRLL